MIIVALEGVIPVADPGGGAPGAPPPHSVWQFHFILGTFFKRSFK